MRNIWRRRAREKTREIKAENRAHRKFKSTRGVKAIMAGEGERAKGRASARRWVAGVCIVAGFVLLALTAAGHFTSLGTYANLEARPWEAFDPELVRSSRDLDALYREAEKRAGGGIEELAPEAAMELLNSIVCARFTHGDQAVHGFFGNWVLYALGKAHPKFRAIRDPETILKRGHSSLCGDVSYALARLANRARIEGRLVSLEGHVVMEARYGGKRRMYNPDYEVTGKGDSGVFRGVAELAADSGAVRAAYSVRTEGSQLAEVLRIYATHQDNVAFDRLSDGPYTGLFPRLERAEFAAEILKFFLPSVLLAFGSILWWMPQWMWKRTAGGAGGHTDLQR